MIFAGFVFKFFMIQIGQKSDGDVCNFSGLGKP